MLPRVSGLEGSVIYSAEGRTIVEHQPSLNLTIISDLTEYSTAGLHWWSQTYGDIGVAELTWKGVGRFRLEYQFAARTCSLYAFGTCEFVIVFAESITGLRPFFECATCRVRTENLYFCDRRWACRACHDLRYASSRKGGSQRKTERFFELQAELAEGWPPGMSRARYAKLSHELGELSSYVEAHGMHSGLRETDERVLFLKTPREPGVRMRYNPLPKTMEDFRACKEAAKRPGGGRAGARVGFDSPEETYILPKLEPFMTEGEHHLAHLNDPDILINPEDR
jgi:hypothetical protein